MSPFKEKFNSLTHLPCFTDEQEEINQKIWYKIKKWNKTDNLKIGISSRKGDGKTFLLNGIMYFKNVHIKNIKNFCFEKNVAHNSEICFADDLDLVDYIGQQKILGKSKIIIFTFTNISKIHIGNFEKYELMHKYRIKYLNINNPSIFNYLQSLESYSFTTLKKLYFDLLNDVSKMGKVNHKNDFLFYQKKFEKIYGNEWNTMKEMVQNSSSVFPKINEHLLSEMDIEYYIEEGWIFKNGANFFFANDEILILLITRRKEFINLIKCSDDLPDICKKYLNSKVFQKSLIAILTKIRKIDLLKNKYIFLRNLYQIKNLDWIDKEHIIFDATSMLEIFMLFNNRKLRCLLPLSTIFNHSYQIVQKWFFNDEEMICMKESFSDIHKLIILSYQIIFSTEDYRLFNHINWKTVFEDLMSSTDTRKIFDFGNFYILFLIRIICQKNKRIKNCKLIQSIKRKITDLYGFDLIDSHKFIANLENENLEYENRARMDLLDGFMYWFDKSGLLADVSYKLSFLDRERIDLDKYKNTILRPFNYKLFTLFLLLTNKKDFYEWYSNNAVMIYKSGWEGKYIENRDKLFFEEYKSYYIMKEAILMIPEMDEWYDTKSYGKIFKKDVRNYEPELWKKMKCIKTDFVTSDFNLDEFVESILVSKKEKIYYPIYINMKYNKWRDCEHGDYSNPYLFQNEIIVDAKSENFKLWNKFDTSEHRLDYSLDNGDDYVKIWWNNGELDDGEIILTCDVKKLKRVYEVDLRSRKQSERPDIIYDLRYYLNDDNHERSRISIRKSKI